MRERTAGSAGGMRDISSLILGAMDAEMAPPRARFDRLLKGLRPVCRITNPLRDVPHPSACGFRLPLTPVLSLLVIALLLGVGTGEGGEWACFRGDESRTGRSGELIQPPLKVKWKISVGGKIASSCTVKDGTVYFGARDNKLRAVSADTGAAFWTMGTGGWVDSSPAVSDGGVYFSSRDGHLYCVDPKTGKMVWKYKTGGTDCSSPIVSNGVVYCGSGFPNKSVCAVDAKTGVVKWRTDTNQMVYSSPAIRGDSLYIGSNDGYVYCLNTSDGAVRWKYHTKGGIYFASPCLDENRLYLAPGNTDWSVYALELGSGRQVWKHDVKDAKKTPTYVSSPSLGDGRIFLVSGYASQYLYCLRSDNGALRWKAGLGPSLRIGFSSSPCVTRETVYAVSAKGKLFAFEGTTGRKVWEHDMKEDVLSSPTAANGMLYVGTMKGTLYAFE